MIKTLITFGLFILTVYNSFGQTKDVPIPPPLDTTKIFSKVEIEASFPGGTTAWREYLEKNLKADVPAKKKAPAGTYTAIVRFIVSKDGSISDIQPETNVGYGMENEVMRVIRKGPKWTPASQDGKKVNAYRRQPITFMITEK